MQTGFVEQGLWSVAFDPKFKENGYFYVSYSSLPFNGAHVIARYTVDPASPDEVTVEQANKSVKVIMNIPQPYYNHYGGGIEFGPDGYLYIGKGDAGWEGDPLDAGQTKDVLWGKILRIDVNTPDGVGYKIPPTNPSATAYQDRMMALFGITEEGFSKIHMGAPPGDLGLRPAQSVLVPLRQEDRQPVHRRRRPEPSRRDRLAAGRQQGRPELRLEVQHGHQVPSDDRARRQVPASSARFPSPSIRTRSPIRVPRS